MEPWWIRTYDDGMRLTICALGNGITDTRSYNSDNTLATITSSNTDIGTSSYTWDENKNKTSETITGPLAAYSFTTGPGAPAGDGYDNEDRLTAYTRGTLAQSWDLSLEGDWNTFTENGVAQNRTYGPGRMIEPGETVLMKVANSGRSNSTQAVSLVAARRF